jgi:multiple sugar transport system permease protein
MPTTRLIGPAVALVFLVQIAPVALAVVLSFLRLGAAQLQNWTAAPFAGIANYRTALGTSAWSDSQLLASAARTGLYALIVTSVSWLLGVIAATLMAAPFRGRLVLQTLFILPFAMPAYATVMSWRFLFDRDSGMINHLLVDDLRLIHTRPFWLIGGNAFWATVLVAIWRLWPFSFLVIAAALRTVPAERYRAAAIDGASAWQGFRHITMPAIRTANVIVLLLSALWCVTDFTTPYLLFNGQPPAAATLLGNLAYRTAFDDLDFGTAAAMNLLTAASLLILVGICRWQLPTRSDSRG